jgi:O-antigen/teichoic acid export membrane protein
MESRSIHSIRNIILGSAHRIVATFLPFIMRTVIINVIGEEYLGLNTLFSSILNVLNLTELGFGNAIAASMYKPIAEKDTQTVSALLRLYRNVYRIIGYVMLLSGIIIMPFLRKLINGDVPQGVNIYILFWLYLAQSAFSYLFWAYKMVLINAHQRSDITEFVGAIVKFITFLLQLIAIVIFKNITLYVFMNVLCVVLNNVICNIIVERKYSMYRCEGKLDDEVKYKIKSNIVALAIHKIGNTVSTSLDTIIISAFLSLSVVAIYGNYNYISSSIGACIILIYSSIKASVGNSIAIESTEKNYKDFCNFSFMNNWIVGWCSISLICLYQPFMKIWLGEKFLLDWKTVICIVICFYIQYLRRVVITYKDAAGMWYADKFKPLVGCMVNLVFNIYLVKNIGVAGVVISTIISYVFVEMPWETHVLFKQYFRTSEVKYYRQLFYTTCTVLAAGGITFYICSYISDGIIGFIIKAVICICVPNAIMIILNCKRTEFGTAVNFIKHIFNILLRKRKL